MKKSALYKATIITFALIPVLAMVRLIYPAPTLDYGTNEVTVNSIFLLLFGIYAFFVLIRNFIRSRDYWKIGDTQWKTKLTFTYIFTFIIALSLPFLMMFQAKESYNYANYPERYTTIGIDAFYPEDFIEALVYVSPAFLFPIGVVLFFLGLAGLQFLKGRAKSYLIIIFSTSVLFVLGGAASAYLVFAWWVGGGIDPW